jgi:hypothetical protein
LWQTGKAIRESWASEAQNLPVTVIFIFGNPGDAKMQKELENEADMYGDILQVIFSFVFCCSSYKSIISGIQTPKNHTHLNTGLFCPNGLVLASLVSAAKCCLTL